MNFDIKRSSKSYINSNEHFIVTADNVVYLRIVGAECNYTVMTATAGEDYDGGAQCPDMVALNESALRTSANLGLQPMVKRDFHGREYVEICNCEYISDAFRAADRLFNYFKESCLDRTPNELADVYSGLAIDGSGEDVYLSDGVWLSSDGTVSVRGR